MESGLKHYRKLDSLFMMFAGSKKHFSVLLIFLILFITTSSIFSQKINEFTKGLSAKIGIGGLSFNGDIFNQNSKLSDRIKAGTNFGFTLGAEKTFTDRFSVDAKLIIGKLGDYNTSLNRIFATPAREFSLNLKTQIFKLIPNNINLGRFSPYASLGLGLFNYNTELKIFSTDQQIIPPEKNTTIIFPIGLGVDIMLNNNVGAFVDWGIKFSGVDNIDALAPTNSGKDRYSFLSAGIKYHFNQIIVNPKKTQTIPGEMSEAERLYLNLDKKNVSDDSRKKGKTKKTQTKSGEISEAERLYLNLDKKNVIDYSNKNEKKLEESVAVRNLKNYGRRDNFGDTDIIVISEVPSQVNAGETFKVDLTIIKGSYSEGLNIRQSYTDGFVPFVNVAGNAKFEFISPDANISWDRLPSDDQFLYSYYVTTDPGLSGYLSIKGTIEWPHSGNKRTKVLENIIFIKNSAVQQDNNTLQNSILSDFSDGNYAQNTVSDYSDVERILALIRSGSFNSNSTSSLTKPISGSAINRTSESQLRPISGSSQVVNSASYQGGTEYRLQIGAFKSRDGGNYFLRKFNITEQVFVDQLNGWFKYTIGSYSDINRAKIARDNFIKRTGLLSTYLVAYRNGTRLNNLPVR